VIPALERLESDYAPLEEFFKSQDEIAAEFVRNGQIAERYRQD